MDRLRRPVKCAPGDSRGGVYARIPAKEVAEDGGGGERGSCGSSQGNTSSQSRATSPPSRLLEGRAITFLHLDPPRAGPVPLGLGRSFPIRHHLQHKVKSFTRDGSEVFSPRPSPSSGLRVTSLWRG